MFFYKFEQIFFLVILLCFCACNAMYNQLNLHNQPFENLSQPLDTLEAFSNYEKKYLTFVNQLDNVSHDNQPSIRQYYYDLYSNKRQEYVLTLYFDLAKKYKDLEKAQIVPIQNKNAKTDSDLVSLKGQFFKFLSSDFSKGAVCTVGVLGLIHFHYLVTHPR